MTENEFARLPGEYQMKIAEANCNAIHITLLVKTENIIGVKETLAEYLEKFGDIKFISVEKGRFL